MACAISTALPLARHIERMSSSNCISIGSLGGSGGSFFLTVVQSWLGRSGATVLSGACLVVPKALVLAVVPGARRSPGSARAGGAGEARAVPGSTGSAKGLAASSYLHYGQTKGRLRGFSAWRIWFWGITTSPRQ